MILESQNLIGSADEIYWFNTLNIVIDCQKNDSSLKQSTQKAINTCVNALNMFREVFKRRPSEMSTNGFVTGQLEAKYIHMSYQLSVL